MKNTKTRTITYMRATWPESFPNTLQRVLRDCLRAFRTGKRTNLPLGDGTAKISHRRMSSQRICLHVAAWTSGEEASIVPHDLDDANENLSVNPPDEKWDYLNGDSMLLVRDNHVLIMPSGLHQRTVERYIRELIRASDEQGAKQPDGADLFNLTEIADANFVQKLHTDGVKSIDLGLGQYRETIATSRRRARDESESIVQRLARDVWESFITSDEDRRRIREASNVHAKLVLNLHGREQGLTAEEFGAVLEPAVGSADENDNIRIRTKSGKTFFRGELRLQKSVEVEAFGKTVSHAQAWDEMIDYFTELAQSGALEQ